MRRWGITAVLCCLCLLLIVSVGLTQRARRGRAGRGRGRAAGGAATLASPVIQGPVHVTPDAIAVRILLGQGDQAPTDWDGSLTVNNGTLLRVEGWRFRQQDQMAGTAAWRARSRRAPQRGGGQQNGAVTPTGVVATLKTTPQTQVQVNTPRGNFSFRTADLAWGKATPFLAGAVQVDLVPAEFQVTGAATEDDFPAATASTDGNVWVAYTSYQYGEPTLPYARGLQEEPKNFDFLRPHGNGDQVRLGRLAKDAEGATFTTVANLTEAAQDVLHPAIAADSTGKVWTVWSQNVAGNWDLYARSYSNGNLSPVYRLTTDPGPDLNPALARDAGGNIYLAWQGFRNGQSDIFLASLAPNAVRWAGPTLVSNSPRNDWEPQLACAGDGTVWIAWDTYDKGDYDVRLRSYSRGQLGNVINVTDSPRFEARPSIVCDPQNRVWLAWEEAPPLWGKDFGFVVQNQGIPLYRGHTVNLKCFVNGQPYHTAGDLAAVLPGGPVQPRAGQGRLGQAARAGAVMQASMPRLWIDAKGRIYLTYRRGAPNLQAPIGTTWLSFVTSYDGNAWTPAAPAPQSDGLLDVRPAFVSSGPGGALYMVHSADGRNHAFGTDPRYEIYISPIAVNAGTAQAATPQLIAETPPAPRAPDTAATAEAANVARMRAVRSIVGSKTYHLLRGDFHRHTEISPDGGGDGPLIDMYRYAIDAAAQDWICAGDHDYGNGREYTWWLIQQLDDAFHVGPQFVPMFGYE
ncbi:MAG: hypothetical protein JOZ57_02750, partial [Abitibacteriaceae bacterium]|nr:hypothetical protein [Abditibacteriaceae bacterium]